ncbi:MAG: Gfo/Idh/MocA family oxidoreductase [Pirellulales bacterium]
MPLRLGIIGAGHLGRFHARLARTIGEIQLVGIADPVAGAAQRVADEIGGCRTVSDFRELIPDIDAAIVAAPTCLHYGIGRELLLRGVHVLMEKPLAPSIGECEDLVALARRQKLVLQVGHIERFSPGFTAVRDAAVGAASSTPRRYSGYSFRSTDIGVVLDLMIHDIDLCLQLAGCGVQSVEAMGLSVFGPHEDLAHARLTFDNGCVAVLQASRVSDVGRRDMEIWSDRTRVRVNFGDRTATIARTAADIARGERSLAGLPSTEVARLKEVVFEELIELEKIEPAANNPMAEEQRDFLEAIREGRDARVNGEHGRDAVAVAERILACIAAGEERRRPNPSPQILRPPHWQTQPTAERRKSA